MCNLDIKVQLQQRSFRVVLDVKIHKGNPCDSQIVPSVLERHKNFYLKSPKQMVFDGCYYLGR